MRFPASTPCVRTARLACSTAARARALRLSGARQVVLPAADSSARR